jgi:sec-independent protein translocase protein TatA
MNLGPPEIILILLVLVLLFGAKKLPELARGSGRALRIFKAETKGLMDDEDDKLKTEEQKQIDSLRVDNTTYDPTQAGRPLNQPTTPPTVQPSPQPSTQANLESDR